MLSVGLRSHCHLFGDVAVAILTVSHLRYVSYTIISSNLALLGNSTPLNCNSGLHQCFNGGPLCWGGNNTRSRQGEENVQYYLSSRANNGTQSRVINKARLPTSLPSASPIRSTKQQV